MKTLKKVVAFFLSFAMVLSVLLGTGISVNGATTDAIDTEKEVVEASSIETSQDNNYTVTVYYNNSNSWSKVYIHYQVNGVWTTVPGVKMSSSKAYADYQWKYTINLGNATQAEVCFNNGYKKWDNNSNNNYVVGVGKYGISKGAVKNLGGNSISKTVYYDNSKTKWSNVYAYVWSTKTKQKEVLTGDWVSDHVKRFRIDSEFDWVIFKNTNSTWEKQTVNLEVPSDTKKIFVPSTTSAKVKGSWGNYTTTNVFYDNAKTNWSSVYAYVWNTKDKTVSPKVISGVKAFGHYYMFEVEQEYTNIIFKNTDGIDNWNKQTKGQTVPTSSKTCFRPSGTSGKVVGAWSDIGRTLVSLKTVDWSLRQLMMIYANGTNGDSYGEGLVRNLPDSGYFEFFEEFEDYEINDPCYGEEYKRDNKIASVEFTTIEPGKGVPCVDLTYDGSVVMYAGAYERDPRLVTIYLYTTADYVCMAKSRRSTIISMGSLFENFYNLRECSFVDKMDTTSVVDMKYMFNQAGSKVPANKEVVIDFTNAPYFTSANVQEAEEMFGRFGNGANTSIILSKNFTITKALYIFKVFQGTYGVIDLGAGLDTSSWRYEWAYEFFSHFEADKIYVPVGQARIIREEKLWESPLSDQINLVEKVY